MDGFDTSSHSVLHSEKDTDATEFPIITHRKYKLKPLSSMFASISLRFLFFGNAMFSSAGEHIGLLKIFLKHHQLATRHKNCARVQTLEMQRVNHFAALHKPAFSERRHFSISQSRFLIRSPSPIWGHQPYPEGVQSLDTIILSSVLGREPTGFACWWCGTGAHVVQAIFATGPNFVHLVTVRHPSSVF